MFVILFHKEKLKKNKLFHTILLGSCKNEKKII